MATSGELSRPIEGDTPVDTIFDSLPPVSQRRKKLLAQRIEFDAVGEIPKHWRWAKFGEITSYGDTPQKKKPSELSADTWILELEDIEAGGKLITKHYGADRETKGEKTVFYAGQVLYSKLRPYLQKVLVADEDGVCTPELVAFDVYGGIEPAYITYWLTTSYVYRVIEKRSYGIKMPRIDPAFMANLPIPIPPIEEQKRIVAKATEALFVLDCLRKDIEAYQHDVAILRSKFIEAAIHGQLTERLPEDGTAEDLLEQVATIRDEMQAARIIRKTKPLPPVTENEEPFEIPSNWKWVHLSDIYRFTNGTASRGTAGGTPRPVLRLADLTDGSIDTSNVREISLTEAEYSSHTIERGNLVIIRVNGSREKVATIYQYLDDAEMSYCDHLFCGKSYSNRISPRYISLICRTELVRKQVDPLIKTTAGQNTISQGNLGKTIIPLPPFAEQERIVDRIDAFFSALPE